MVFKILSLMLLLLQGTSAMNIKFNSVNCKEEAITLAFDRICTENNTCTIGTQANLVGSVSYYGLYDQYGLTADSAIYVDMNMSLYALGSETLGKQISQLGQPMYNATLYDMNAVPVCHESMSAYDNNDYACPSTGTYQFHSSITLPQPGNGFQTWAYTGYNGTGELAIYAGAGYNSRLLGSCSFAITTEQEEKVGIKAPSGQEAMIALIAAGAVMFVLGLICCFCACRKNKEKSVVRKVAPLISIAPEDKVDGHFRMMEEETIGEAHRRGWFSYV